MSAIFTVPLILFLFSCAANEDFYYRPFNITRTTPSGIAAYRSALTLDWLAAEDSRQRELVAAFETEAAPPAGALTTNCIAYPRPTSGKIAWLMLELLKNLEGDDGTLIPDLIQALIRTKLLVLETSMLDSEPDFEALVKTPGLMMGEPHATFPRVLAMVWLTVTDPSTRKYGWCAIKKVSKYLTMSKPADVAKNMRALEPVLARARFIMEEFIQHVTPLNIVQKTLVRPKPTKTVAVKSYGIVRNPKIRRPIRTQLDGPHHMMHAAPLQPNTTNTIATTLRTMQNYFFDETESILFGSSNSPHIDLNLLFCVVLIVYNILF